MASETVHVWVVVSGLLECEVCGTLWCFARPVDQVEEVEDLHCQACSGSLDLLLSTVMAHAVLAPPLTRPCSSRPMIDKQKAIEAILQREGGWNDRADDPGNADGGATNWGWTLTQFRKVTNNPGATKDDLRALTREAAGELHWQEFFVKTRIAGIPNPVLAELVADAAVNSGPRNAIRMLQRALGFKGADVDGILGTVTMHSIPADGATLARLFLAERADFIAAWVAGDLSDADRDGIPDRLENHRGIMKRITDQWRNVA